MRQPDAQALCESTVRQGPPQGYIYTGGGLRPAAPPVEESLVDILEEDPGAQCFRIGLAHRAGAYPAAAPGAICCHNTGCCYLPPPQTVPPPPQTVWGQFWDSFCHKIHKYT